jgi:hypothetical protein
MRGLKNSFGSFNYGIGIAKTVELWYFNFKASLRSVYIIREHRRVLQNDVP